MELKCATFIQDHKLTDFVNSKNITKEQIQDIVVVPLDKYQEYYKLFYWEK